MLLRVLTAARCKLVAFLSHFCANHERTSVNPGLSHVSESQSTSGLSIDSEMYSFASGTIVSARTSSPSMPGTQPVSSNISLGVSRRAPNLLSGCLAHDWLSRVGSLDPHALLPEGQPLPSSVMNARLFTRSPRRRAAELPSEARCRSLW